MGNKNVTKIIQNLIECSNRIDNKIILFAFDSEISEACKNLCQVVNMYPYGEPYTKIGNIYYQKLLIANEIIKRNKIAMYIDADCIIQHNFKQDMLELYTSTDADCLVQSVEHKEWLGEGINCGTGIFSIRPTEKTKNMFTEQFLIDNNYDKYGDDQEFFNKVIKLNNMLKINYLSKDDYPNGNHYYRNKEKISKTFKVFHVTNLYGYKDMDPTKEWKGIPQKIKSMKYLNYWYI